MNRQKLNRTTTSQHPNCTIRLVWPSCLAAHRTQLKLDELTANAAKLSDRARFLTKTAEPLRAEHTTIREELYHIRHTTDKYTDSDKVSYAVVYAHVCKVRPSRKAPY